MNRIEKLLRICMFPFLSIVASCSNDFDEPFIEIEEKQTTKTDKAWESQLDNVLRKQTRNSSNKLSLIGYDYYKEIASTVELNEGLDEIFADTAHIAFQNYIDYDFEIYSIGDVKVSEYDSIRTRFDFNLLRDEIYCAFEQSIENGNNAHLIKLKWSYNGDIIYSTAIATDKKGVLFETIGFLIITNKKSVSDEKDIPSTFTKLKNRSETSTVSVIKRFVKQDIVENLLTLDVCEYYIMCSSSFNSFGVLIDREKKATAKGNWGYTATAGVEFISGSLYSSNFNEFAWAWACSSGSSLSVSFNGVGFSISGSSYSDTGSDVHTAN